MKYSFALYYLILCTVNAKSVQHVKTYSGYKEFQITGSKDDLDRFKGILKNLDESHLHHRRNATSLFALVSPSTLPLFEASVQKQNLKTTLIFDDIAELIREEKAGALQSRKFSWTSYYDIDDIYGYLQNVSTTYPEWTELVVGGASYEGRQIMGLRINTPRGGADKPAFFIEAGIHAREWITPATTTYFIQQLLTSEDPAVEALRHQFDWHVFPSVNPDGYHYSYNVDRYWRKTRSKSPNGCYGADANRNWDYDWLKYGANDNQCDYQEYGGSKPFSEKETRTLSSYIGGVRNLLAYVAFHADAQMLLIPYSDSEDHVDNYDDLVEIGKKSLEYGYEVNKEKYDGPAPAPELLYKASGGSMDWVRFALGTPLVYTYELRGYYFHWPARLIYQQGDEVTQMMVGLVKGASELGYCNLK